MTTRAFHFIFFELSTHRKSRIINEVGNGQSLKITPLGKKRMKSGAQKSLLFPLGVSGRPQQCKFLVTASGHKVCVQNLCRLPLTNSSVHEKKVA